MVTEGELKGIVRPDTSPGHLIRSVPLRGKDRFRREIYMLQESGVGWGFSLPVIGSQYVFGYKKRLPF